MIPQADIDSVTGLIENVAITPGISTSASVKATLPTPPAAEPGLANPTTSESAAAASSTSAEATIPAFQDVKAKPVSFGEPAGLNSAEEVPSKLARLRAFSAIPEPSTSTQRIHPNMSKFARNVLKQELDAEQTSKPESSPPRQQYRAPMVEDEESSEEVEEIPPMRRHQGNPNSRAARKMSMLAKFEYHEGKGEYYAGTYEGVDYNMTHYPVDKDCHKGIHQLACGHYIYDESAPLGQPCGVNCHKPHNAAAFDCTACREEIQHFLDTDLSCRQKAKLALAEQSGDKFLYAMYLTEFAARKFKGNVVETVAARFGHPGLPTRPSKPAPAPHFVDPRIDPVLDKILDIQEDRELARIGREAMDKKYGGDWYLGDAVKGAGLPDEFFEEEDKKIEEEERAKKEAEDKKEAENGEDEKDDADPLKGIGKRVVPGEGEDRLAKRPKRRHCPTPDPVDKNTRGTKRAGEKLGEEKGSSCRVRSTQPIGFGKVAGFAEAPPKLGSLSQDRKRGARWEEEEEKERRHRAFVSSSSSEEEDDENEDGEL